MHKNFYVAILFLFISSWVYSQSVCLNEKSLNQLHKLFSDEFKDDEPGGAVLIKKGDEIIYSGSFGFADMETVDPINENTVFNTGSISKTFVANGILILQDRGLLSIEDSIDKYFDDFENEEIAAKVKIKHLLSHTSGLPDNREVRRNFDFFLTAKDDENFEPLKRAISLNFDPGENFQYSNPSYNGLALIIQRVSRQPWQEFIIENIFEPCGMPLSKITDGPHPSEDVAHAYVDLGFDFAENDYGEVPTFAASGNGGVWSTVHELANYEVCIQNSVFLESTTVKSSRTIFKADKWKASSAPFLGWGWFLGEKNLIGSESNLGVDIVYHTGSQGGFRAYYISIPEKKILSIGLFNRPLDSYNSFMSEPLKLLAENNWLD